MNTARVRAQISEWVVIIAVIGATLALSGWAAVVGRVIARVVPA